MVERFRNLPRKVVLNAHKTWKSSPREEGIEVDIWMVAKALVDAKGWDGKG